LPATLYALPASHPSAAIEAALRLKGVPYERVDLIPVMAKPLLLSRFGASTVPAVVFEDGKRVQGSREIVRELEHRAPEPPLLPLDGNRRRAVEAAERWGDEVLQPLARRLAWATLVRAPGSVMSYSEGADLPLPDFAARLSAPVMTRLAARINQADEGNVRADLINLDLHLDRADHWLEIGAMGGEQPTAADFQVGSGLALLLTLGDVAPRVDSRPCADVARRWFPDYPGSTPAGVLPRAWVEAKAP
jgi:glutathione S-transferase